MKTFIFIFILIVGFFYFLFVENGTKEEKNNKVTSDLNAVTLEDIEEENNITIIHDEVQTETTLFEEAPSSIPEEQTFDTIKNILKEVSGKTYTSNITLNTRLNSYLYTVEKREQFKQGIASAFNISYKKVDEMSKKNKLIWDWVNDLRE